MKTKEFRKIAENCMKTKEFGAFYGGILVSMGGILDFSGLWGGDPPHPPTRENPAVVILVVMMVVIAVAVMISNSLLISKQDQCCYTTYEENCSPNSRTYKARTTTVTTWP